MENIKFISIDWGTSNFRLRVVDTSLKILSFYQSNDGVKSTYQAWKSSGQDRFEFYFNFLKQKLSIVGVNSSKVPLIISGMASSNIGLKELDYKSIPIKIYGKNLVSEQIYTTILPNPVLLISGLKSETDVMRGEEVQLFGLHNILKPKNASVFIFPGTHSKHIFCDKTGITNFMTYMTGELFEVISKHSVLSNSLSHGKFDTMAKNAFEEGLGKIEISNSLSNTLFLIRTNSLFRKKTEKENFYFLSGLLIGEELKNIAVVQDIKLCAGQTLSKLYEAAIKFLGLNKRTEIIDRETVEYSAVIGQNMVLENTSI